MSAAVATKEHQPEAPSIANNHIATAKDTGGSQSIPERLQNLAGQASVYHATAPSSKSGGNARHSLFSYRPTSTNNNDYSCATSLTYVASATDASCEYESCSNKPVDDHRWDGQYCSATCLINDCRDAFSGWLADQRALTRDHEDDKAMSDEHGRNGHRLSGDTGDNFRSSSVTGDNDEEIMQYLASPPREERPPRRVQSHSGSDSDSISRDENLFASLQQHYFPSSRTETKVVNITLSDDDDGDRGHSDMAAVNKPRYSTDNYISLMTDIDGDTGSLSPLKLRRSGALHSSPDLCSSSQCTSVAISSHSEG